MFQYSVAYRIDLSSRVIHRTVIARDADDARERVKAVDPRFLATAKSPRRGKAVVDDDDEFDQIARLAWEALIKSGNPEDLTFEEARKRLRVALKKHVGR